MHEMMCIVYYHSVGNKIKGRMAAGDRAWPWFGLWGFSFFTDCTFDLNLLPGGEIKNYSKLR